jgi:membrane protease YdiL (CAAX protease family)
MFDSLINTLLVIAALYVYLSLARQVSARQANGAGAIDDKRFGWPEALAAALLVGWFGLNVLASLHAPETTAFRARDLFLTGAFSIAVILLLTSLLQLRGFSVLSLGGFSRLSFGRIISTAAVLLFAAYPLLFVADEISRWFIDGSSRQQIIEMFTGSETLQQRVLIIILAICIAPMTEEFIFRFFLYGVLKRYLGRSAGLLLNALLFAAVHVHLPSFGPLFLLGSCLTLAYEWSGSILVPMTMHALFNFFTLSALAFPNLLPR